MKALLLASASVLVFTTVSCADKGARTGTGGSTGTGTGSGGAVGTGGVPDEMCGGASGSGAGGAGGDLGVGGAGGDVGGAGVGGGAPLAITSAEFGDFHNSFLITPCMSPGTGFDCPNRPALAPTTCPTTPWSYGKPLVTTSEATGNTYNEVFTVTGGNPDTVYNVTVRVLGQAEGRTYTGGTRALAAAVDPNAATNDLLYTGGRPGTTRVDYNIMQMTIAPPRCVAPIAGAPTYYAFNAVDTGHEGQHLNYGIDSTFTFKVRSGFTVTLTSHDSNCIAIKNCGGGTYNFSTAAACEAAARATHPDVTLPATFNGQTLTNPDRFQTQYLNFKVVSIVAE